MSTYRLPVKAFPTLLDSQVDRVWWRPAGHALFLLPWHSKMWIEQYSQTWMSETNKQKKKNPECLNSSDLLGRPWSYFSMSCASLSLSVYISYDDLNVKNLEQCLSVKCYHHYPLTGMSEGKGLSKVVKQLLKNFFSHSIGIIMDSSEYS